MIGGGLTTGLFAIAMQILALCAVSCPGPGRSVRGYIMGAILVGCVMVEVVTLNPSVFSYRQIDPMAKVATCH